MSLICNQVIDITHHSKRTQAGNLINAGKNVVDNTKDTGVIDSNSNVPVNVTIESAIEYYKNNATGSFANLYSFTVDVLEKYRKLSKKAINDMKSQENSDVVEVDINEVK